MEQAVKPAAMAMRPLKSLGGLGLLALVYYLAARGGLLLAFADSNATPVWPPSGIALAALLLYGSRCWPAILIGAFAANLTVFSANQAVPGWTGIIVSLCIALGNTAEALVGATLFKRLAGPEKQLIHLQNVYKFALVALAAGILSASIGSASLLVGAIIPAQAAWTVFGTWWLGDVSGILVVTPLLLAWWGRRRSPWRAAAMSEAVLSLLLLVLLMWLIFDQPGAADAELRWLAYLVIPCIGWAAYRHGLRGATLVCLLAAGAAVWASAHGLGPFAGGTLNDALLGLGCFIGLCSMIGLVLCADLSERRRQHSLPLAGRQIVAHWLTLFLCLGLTVLAWHLVSADTERRAREQFNMRVATLAQRMVERIDSYRHVLRGAQALFATSLTVGADDWRAYAAAMASPRNFPGIKALGYAPYVVARDRDAFERATRAGRLPDFAIKPPGARDDYVPITLIEPDLPRNRRGLGFDMASDPIRRDAMARAMASGQPSLSGKITLLAETGSQGNAGFLMYMPVHQKDPAKGVRPGAAVPDGYVFGAFRVSELMNGLLANLHAEIEVEVFDGTGRDAAARLLSTGQRSARERIDYPHPFEVERMIDLDDHRWTIVARSLPAFEQAIDRQKAHLVLIAGIVISLLLFGVVRALSARREYAQALANEMTSALQQSEKKFESLIDAASEVSIIATSLDGTIEVFSVGAERMLGYRAGEMVRRHTPALLHLEQEVAARGLALGAEFKREVAGFEVFVARARDGIADSGEWTYRRKDGSTLQVNLVVTAITDRAGQVAGFLGVATDITRPKQLQASLQGAKEQAEAASRAKSDFLANMSHEIRTPMNAVLGMVHLLGSTTLDRDQKEYLAMLRSSGQSLLGILNDILDFSKIEAGRVELDSAPFLLGDIINAVAGIMAVNAGDKDLELAIAVAPEVPQALVGDALRLQQVLVNLVGNAIKFTERGEVAVLVELLEQDQHRVRLQLCVRDTGIGIDAQQQARLFAPFSQADASVTRRFGGTGLGLAISRRLVELMGGTLDVDSTPGRGSAFCVKLTLLRGSGPAADVPSALSGLRVLVVDDNHTSRDYLSLTIRAWGWHAESVATGVDALARIGGAQAAGQPFNILLADWQMPGMDGLATMQALRAQLPACALPVVIMTSAFGRGKLMQQDSAAEASAILLKPVTASSLFDTLHDVLGQRGEAARLVAFEPRALRQRLDGARLLLVEDNPLNQVVARGILGQAGAEVELAGDGEQALALLRADPRRYALILMDVQMPVMDGMAATRLIRQELGLTLPVLAMSAGVMASEREQCFAAGMNDFIAKPIDVATMLATIRRHLDVPAHAAALAPPSPPLSPAAPALPAADDGIFNPQILLELGNGDPAQRLSLLNLVGSMARRSRAEFDAARASWHDGDTEAAARALHGMRGGVGTFGARRFVAAALALEQALRDADTTTGTATTPVTPLFDAAATELARTIEAAQRWLEQEGA